MSETSHEPDRRLGHRVGAPVPISTYRLQLNEAFTFADAAARLDYFAALGVTHLYLSPILEASPGSTHFYDVVDHSRVAPVLGGEAGLRDLAWKAGERGIGLVADVVPNHMAVPTPAYFNKALWSVLTDGEESDHAHWFDVDWSGGDPVLMPVLGQRIGTVLANGELVLDSMVVPGFEDKGEVPVLRYYEHVFPVRRGTENLPLASLVDQQHYRLAYWRVANEEPELPSLLRRRIAGRGAGRRRGRVRCHAPSHRRSHQGRHPAGSAHRPSRWPRRSRGLHSATVGGNRRRVDRRREDPRGRGAPTDLVEDGRHHGLRRHMARRRAPARPRRFIAPCGHASSAHRRCDGHPSRHDLRSQARDREGVPLERSAPPRHHRAHHLHHGCAAARSHVAVAIRLPTHPADHV
ncbi:alpha-amylase family glycosyl hydrolase [Demequina litorisediminis]|uniref:alpha-amylase family glycosyl hydrolase n=1 Tax=Demequina litorisediminis TaxID=1849022 RepID=UPI0024E09870|nr:alpha-amylase family glycosyl hydrolase [Demequina litorisediminis]